MPIPHDSRRTVLTALDDMFRALGPATAVQWDKAPVQARPTWDTEEKSKGGPVADPTADIVLDERRTAVREAVQEAEALVWKLLVAVPAINEALDHSVEAWSGDHA